MKLIFSVLFLSIIFFNAARAEPAIRLPDGTYFPLRKGEAPYEAQVEAMKLYPESFGLLKIPDEKKMDITWFNKCRIDGVKNAKTDLAVGQVVASCRELAVPKKCRLFQIQRDTLGNEKGDARVSCIEECRASNYYSRNIGECSPG